MADPSRLQVINTRNLIVCTGCPKPQPLVVTSQMGTTCEGELSATVADCAPMVNLAPFGPCLFTPLPPSSSGGPCVPKPVGQWTPGALSTTYEGLRALRRQDILPCAAGGVISVVQPGQLFTFIE